MGSREERTSEGAGVSVDVRGHSSGELKEGVEGAFLGIAVNDGHLDATLDLFPLHLIAMSDLNRRLSRRGISGDHIDCTIKKRQQVAGLLAHAAIHMGLSRGLMPVGALGHGLLRIQRRAMHHGVTHRHARVVGAVAMQG